ncbi:hypothetical protein [Profundibacter sp.]
MNKIPMRLAGAIIGVIAAAIAMGVIYLLLVGMMELLDVNRARFRVPVAFLFLPIIGLFTGWKVGPDLVEAGAIYWQNSMLFRASILVPLVWIALVLFVIVLFEPRPFKYGFSDRNFIVLMKIILIPPSILAILFGTYRLIRGKK